MPVDPTLVTIPHFSNDLAYTDHFFRLTKQRISSLPGKYDKPDEKHPGFSASHQEPLKNGGQDGYASYLSVQKIQEVGLALNGSRRKKERMTDQDKPLTSKGLGTIGQRFFSGNDLD